MYFRNPILYIMRIKSLLIGLFVLLKVVSIAQTNPKPVPSPSVNVYAPILSFLASDWMEGREASSRGGFMAGDYMASMMQVFGLKPMGDKRKKELSYFQNFEILRHTTEKSSLAFINRTTNSQITLQLAQGIDYEIKGGTKSIDAETLVVFAGYGITVPDKGYDDYKALDVKGKIVLVLKGFPGHADTTSMAWKKLNNYIGEDGVSFETKLQTARNNGAIALIMLDADSKFEPFQREQKNQLLLNSTMNSVKNTDGEEY